MASLKQKITLGYLFLVLLSLLAGIWAIFNFDKLVSNTIDLTEDNYKSVVAAQNMIGAIERQDSAQLILLLKHEDKALQMINDAKSEFKKWFVVASNNITVPHEDQIILGIDAAYHDYDRLNDQLMNNQKAGNHAEAEDLYFSAIDPQFKSLRKQLQNLAEINNRTMFQKINQSLATTRQATMVVLLAALVAVFSALALAANQFKTIIRPAKALSEVMKKTAQGELGARLELFSKDEIGKLTMDFNEMSEKLQQKELNHVQKLLAQEKKLASIINVITDGIIVTDHQFNILTINPKAGEILNTDQDQTGNVNLFEVVKSSGARRLFKLALARELKERGEYDVLKSLNLEEDAGESVNLENAIPLDANHKLFYTIELIKLTPQDMEDAQYLLVIRDITQFKEIDQLKTEMISKISHELKTPLTSMLLGIEMLNERIANKKEKNIIDALTEETVRLNRLVNGLLELSKWKMNKLELKLGPVNLADLITHIVNTFKMEANDEGKKIELHIAEDDLTARIDSDKVSSVLSNLIANALRYSPPDGTVTISAHKEKEFIQIAVADLGPGIPQEMQEKIFDEFFQIKGRPGGNAGLGLAIAEEIVKAHHGSIWVESDGKKGSVFKFKIPNKLEGKM
ncbi:HAMP domain-containing sensor histidine kinase [Candidatus Formimonas warabiya]|uniref:histidine kinase n=1 Tax=Formimonas warabiya TaxID=1761012 RepID=A0A3G1KWR7_FORW1|nr:ATP-binding protein [Candidatus Formimonas warabiya]ATW26892.1 hypothetical protein DCMF_20900 [Candidatus Formimonas warabiya]